VSTARDSIGDAPSRAEKSDSALHSRPKVWTDWITRPLFGLLLAAVAIAATVYGGIAFVLFVCVGSAAAVREWHRMFTNRGFWPSTIVSTVAIACALFFEFARGRWIVPGGTALVPFLILLGGAATQMLLALRRNEGIAAHALGVLYVGVPALSFLLLRLSPVHPLWIVLMLFLAIWATDTGALIAGSLIGGRKLAPAWSPKKTWAGFFGGLACAAVISGGTGAVLSAAPATAVLFGLVISLAAQMGDLFESVVKRRAGRKNSGELIPGHGGVLDRIDSSLFAAPIAAILVLGMGFDPLSGMIV
jgi:phosphatidate cytidylyltransferase